MKLNTQQKITWIDKLKMFTQISGIKIHLKNLDISEKGDVVTIQWAMPWKTFNLGEPQHPWVYLKKFLKSKWIKYSDFAKAMWISHINVSFICTWKRNISTKLALGIEREFPWQCAEYWLTLQMQYDLSKVKNK